MTDLTELIERVEKVEGPDRELDCLIELRLHLGVFQQLNDPEDIWDIHHGPGHGPPWPAYTGSLDAKLPGEDIIGTSEQKQQEGKPVMWVAVHRMPRGQMTIAARGRTEALARRAAALKARKGTKA